MKTVILAAGFGSRLWPLSTSERPKQFQKLINDTSLLQHTYDLLGKVNEIDELYILTLAGLEHLVFEQLPNISPANVIIVPERRNTLPHTAYALNKLEIANDEPVMFAPVDHYFASPEKFVDSLKRVCQEIPATLNETYLICTPTTKPDSSLGYVVMDSDNTVLRFVEKPDATVIKELTKLSGLHINTSRYVTSISAFTSLLESIGDGIAVEAKAVVESNPDQLSVSFLAMPFADISSEVFENATHLKGVPFECHFTDVGKFSTLYEINKKDQRGNATTGLVVLDDESRNNFVINLLEQPLAVVNTKSAVIVQTPSGTVVSPMNEVDQIGKIYKSKIHSS